MRVIKSMALIGTALMALSAGTPAKAEEVTLRAASFLPEQASFGWPFYRWVEEVNNQCDGKVQIEVLAPGSVQAFQQPNALKTGVIDMMSGPPAYYKGIMIEGDTAVLSNVSTSEQRENGAWEYLNRLHNEKVNAQYLTAFGDGVRFYIYTRRPAENGRFEDFTLRSIPIYETFFQELGANTVTIPPPDVYTALERGTVDGYGWPLWGISDFGWDKHTTHRYEPGFFNVVVNILVNLDRWQAMNDDQRECLNRMAVWLEEEWPGWRDSHSEQEAAKQEEAGIEVVDLGEEHRERAHQLYWQALERESPEHVRALRELLVK